MPTISAFPITATPWSGLTDAQKAEARTALALASPNTFLSGAGVPAAGLGSNGDTYLRVTTDPATVGNGDVYAKAAGAWAVVGNLRGPQGAASGGGGATGPVEPSGTYADASFPKAFAQGSQASAAQSTAVLNTANSAGASGDLVDVWVGTLGSATRVINQGVLATYPGTSGQYLFALSNTKIAVGAAVRIYRYSGGAITHKGVCTCVDQANP